MAHDLERFFNALRGRRQLDLVLTLTTALPSARQRDLVERLGIDRPYLSREVGRLIDQGLLARDGGIRSALYVPMPDHVRRLIELAIEIRAGARGGPTEAERDMLRDLARARMARGAEEQTLGRPQFGSRSELPGSGAHA